MKRYLFNIKVVRENDPQNILSERDSESKLCGKTYAVREDGKLSRFPKPGLETYTGELARDFPTDPIHISFSEGQRPSYAISTEGIFEGMVPLPHDRLEKGGWSYYLETMRRHTTTPSVVLP